MNVTVALFFIIIRSPPNLLFIVHVILRALLSLKLVIIFDLSTQPLIVYGLLRNPRPRTFPHGSSPRYTAGGALDDSLHPSSKLRRPYQRPILDFYVHDGELEQLLDSLVLFPWHLPIRASERRRGTDGFRTSARELRNGNNVLPDVSLEDSPFPTR